MNKENNTELKKVAQNGLNKEIKEETIRKVLKILIEHDFIFESKNYNIEDCIKYLKTFYNIIQKGGLKEK